MAHIGATIQSEVSRPEELLSGLLVFNSEDNTIMDEAITKTIAEITCFSEQFHLGDETVD